MAWVLTRGKLKTNVHVMDGETVVLGGVFEGSKSELVNKVPFLADLPGIGFYLKKQILKKVKRNYSSLLRQRLSPTTQPVIDGFYLKAKGGIMPPFLLFLTSKTE